MSKQTLEKIFGSHGLLAKRLKDFHPRAAQLSMATAIAKTIQQREWLIAEAATGTGKTFAYLIPSLISGQKILISTATKTLQDQLVLQDLPRILNVLGLSRSVQNLKGRDNYLCKYHVQRLLSEGNAYQLSFYHELVKIFEQMPQLQAGEKSELQDFDQNAWYWSEFNAKADHCLASKCPLQAECFLYQARQKAMAADCVVVNHHLFFADSRLKADGFGALLPMFEIIIFDEAHQLVDIATHFYSQSFSTAGLLRICQELGARPELAISPIQAEVKILDASVEQFLQSFANEPLETKVLDLLAQGLLPWDHWATLLHKLLEHLAACPELEKETWVARIESILAVMTLCENPQTHGISWLKSTKRHVRFQWTPFSVAEETQALISNLQASLIFTSATLKTQGHFSWFQHALGLDNAKTEAWESPYDWQQQAMLYLPHGLPDVYHPRFYQELLSQVLPVIQLLGGRTLFLFTSHRALAWVAEALPKRCHLPLLVQGQADKSKLLQAFRQQPQAILLGTGSFWEGVDVQGDCLSCVIIDKLPFANVAEPWLAAKLKYLEKQGQAVFDDYLIPHAILSLKQGIGRLIRTETDKGVLIIGDPRLYGRQYGKDFKESLPPMRWTRSYAKVSGFIQTFKHEIQDETLVSL